MDKTTTIIVTYTESELKKLAFFHFERGIDFGKKIASVAINNAQKKRLPVTKMKSESPHPKKAI